MRIIPVISVPSRRSHWALPAEGRPGPSDDDDDNCDDGDDDGGGGDDEVDDEVGVQHVSHQTQTRVM